MNGWLDDWSSRTAAALAALASVGIARRYLWPRMRRVFNRGVDLTGSWKITHLGRPDDDEEECLVWEQTANLKHFGRSVKGKAEATRQDESGRWYVKYGVSGHFYNNILDIIFTEKSASMENRTVFLLQTTGGAGSLVGRRVYLGRQTNEVRSIKCRWDRVDNHPSRCGAV